jgi:hypothetical protein
VNTLEIKRNSFTAGKGSLIQGLLVFMYGRERKQKIMQEMQSKTADS